MSIIHRRQIGPGSAYIAGFRRRWMKGAAIGQMDVDFPTRREIAYHVGNAPILYVVLGSRYVSGGSVDVQWPLWRKGLSALAMYMPVPSWVCPCGMQPAGSGFGA